jgi:hypothetical protein
MSGRLVRHWKDRESLKYAVLTSLVAPFGEQPGLGWIRANAAASEEILNQINELRIRNDELLDINKRLKQELTPKIDNLASLDSTFLVHYQYRYRTANETRQIKSSLTMTWRTIFAAIGPQLVRAHQPSVISSYLDTYIVEKNLVKDRFPHILDATENQIKIQLSALGLIKNFQSLNTAGAMSEWIQLTDLGTRTLYETMTIREKVGE